MLPEKYVSRFIHTLKIVCNITDDALTSNL